MNITGEGDGALSPRDYINAALTILRDYSGDVSPAGRRAVVRRLESAVHLLSQDGNARRAPKAGVVTEEMERKMVQAMVDADDRQTGYERCGFMLRAAIEAGGGGGVGGSMCRRGCRRRARKSLFGTRFQVISARHIGPHGRSIGAEHSERSTPRCGTMAGTSPIG